MNDLNNLDKIKNLDPKNVLVSTGLLLEQCSQILIDAKPLSFPNEYLDIKNIVFSGMGGSALGAQIVYNLYKKQLSLPFYINNDYNLPGFVDENTLVILSSYSGTTEETLSSAKDAIDKKCKITAITTGGDLAKLMEDKNFPYLKFEPKNNPSGQPRLGIGYSVFGTIILLSKLGVLGVNNNDLTKAIESIRQTRNKIEEDAKLLSKSLQNTIPVIFASEFLIGNAHVLRNQFNETAKTFSTYSPLPELNHHLMEGLKNPPEKNLKILFLESDLYSEKLKNRIQLTKDVVLKNNLSYESYKALENSALSQVLEILLLGGYLTFYLAILYDQDPSVIPWVDYFKKELAK